MINSQWNINDTGLGGLKIITPFYTEDERGYFLKDYEEGVFKELGIEAPITECMESYSKKDVIRGLHFQVREPQIKMIKVVSGIIWDVLVDLRNDSPTFGKYEGIILSEINHNIIWAPAGFAHGYRVLSDYAIVTYKCSGKYDKESDTGIIYNDKDLNINWGYNVDKCVISQRDLSLMSFYDFKKNIGGL